MHEHHEHHEHAKPNDDAVSLPRSQHAFFVVGTQHLFLVHQTNMWIDCHQYQFIARARIPPDAKQRFLEDRNRHPTDWYIVGNDADDLISLPDIQRGKRTSFTGSIWRGWPKNEGTPHWPWAKDEPIVGHFDVEVERIVHFRHFDFNFNPPNTLSYILFGRGDEAHLQHYQVKQPDFDHVLTLSKAPAWLPEEALEAGMHVNFPDIPAVPGGVDCGQAVHCTNPLKNGTHHVQFAGYGPTRPITVDRTLFFGTFPVNEVDPCRSPKGPAQDAAGRP
jgi:hypothetical protein